MDFQWPVSVFSPILEAFLSLFFPQRPGPALAATINFYVAQRPNQIAHTLHMHRNRLIDMRDLTSLLVCFNCHHPHKTTQKRAKICDISHQKKQSSTETGQNSWTPGRNELFARIPAPRSGTWTLRDPQTRKCYSPTSTYLVGHHHTRQLAS